MRTLLLTTLACFAIYFQSAAQKKNSGILSADLLQDTEQQAVEKRWSIALKDAYHDNMDTVIANRFILSGVDAVSGRKVFKLVGVNSNSSLKIVSLLQGTGNELKAYPGTAAEATVVICTGCGADALPEWNGTGWSCGASGSSARNCTKVTTAISID